MPQFDDRFSKGRLDEIRRGEEDRLIKALAPQHGLEYVDLTTLSINPEALHIIDEAAARASLAVAFEIRQNILSVAVRNPNQQNTQELLTRLQKQYEIVLYMCSTASLEHAWNRYADRVETHAEKQGVLDIDPRDIEAYSLKINDVQSVVDLVLNVRTSNNARRVSETLELIFAGALALGASDVHIEPEETVVRLRYRLDGVLIDIIDLDQIIYERLMSRLKLLSGMLLNRHDEAQDGRFTINLSEKQIEIRSSVIPGSGGESIVMRLLDPSVASFSFDKLGLSPRMIEVMNEQLAKPNGMIITTGPTGSGKTTALYAFLRKVHNPGIKIITIEDPVEYKVEDIVQTQVGDEYTFASGLRAVLRQDPDVIMVGEIRDREVAETAVHSAQTGHLVFSTLHTNNAAGAFPRLSDLGVDPRVMGSAINIIIAQRLVRTLCNACKFSRLATPSETDTIMRILKTHPNPPAVSEPLTIYDHKGCAECNNTGFRGRVGVFEGIIMDEAVEEVVIRDPREHIIVEAARPQKIPTMSEHGIEKVVTGETSFAELVRVVDLSNSHTAVDAQEIDNQFLSHII